MKTYSIRSIFFALGLLAIPCQIIAQATYIRLNKNKNHKELSSFVMKRLNYFTTNGDWNGPPELKPNRSLEPLALCHAFLASGNVQAIDQANAYLTNAKDLEWHRACYVFLKYPKLLSEKSKLNIRHILDSIAPGYLEPSWDFVGTNDNFPSMAAAGCAMYAEISGNMVYQRTAMHRLERFCRQLRRSGLNSEYSSQAYCFLQVEGMAMLAENTHNLGLKALALKIEERFWFDILGHFYTPAQKMSAPFSRAYAWDMRGAGLAYTMLSMVLGNLSPQRYLDDYFEPSEEWIKCRNAACYGIDYHCPRYLVKALAGRKYPYSFIATADGSPGSDDTEIRSKGLSMSTRSQDLDDDITEYGCWQTRVETFMMPAYSLSTSLVPFHSGAQSENFLLVYPRNGKEKAWRNTATVFSRLVVNDEFVLKSPSSGYGSYGIVFNEQGRRIALQHQNTAMVLYKPKSFLHTAVKSLRACIFIPAKQWMQDSSGLDEVWIGNRKLQTGIGRSSVIQPVFIRDGNVFMAYVPLIPGNKSASIPVEIERKDGYTIVSFYNYLGAPTDFTKRSFDQTGNGFVCEVSSSEESGSFTAFRLKILRARIIDEYRSYVHYRNNAVRYTSYSRNGLTLENEYSPGTETIRYSTVNGKYISKPRLKVSGKIVAHLPLNK